MSQIRLFKGDKQPITDCHSLMLGKSWLNAFSIERLIAPKLRKSTFLVVIIDFVHISSFKIKLTDPFKQSNLPVQQAGQGSHQSRDRRQPVGSHRSWERLQILEERESVIFSIKASSPSSFTKMLFVKSVGSWGYIHCPKLQSAN